MSSIQQQYQQNQPLCTELLSIPQLDAITRTLRLIDVRLQHIQGSSTEEAITRGTVDHIRRVMSENQEALSTVVTVLALVQEEVRKMSITLYKLQELEQKRLKELEREQHIQRTTFSIAPPPRKSSAERPGPSNDRLSFST